ncbi:Copia protein [Cyphomyrmex costatus]|uniref:Copia protein n=1 Tax=Cyphomyrmex costatus TaxID=456900 RepID=A0A151II87_9HYME|nr:Copia protein [Cyphomyrmex costatus]
MIRNRVPLDRLNGITPWEAFTSEQPDVSSLRIYGSEAYAHIEDQFRNKFDKKSKKLVLVGYEPGCKAYRLWDKECIRTMQRQNC